MCTTDIAQPKGTVGWEGELVTSAKRRGAPAESTPEWERLTALCKAQGRSKEWVARQVGMGTPRLWHILHRTYGYPVPAGLPERLAEVLGAPVYISDTDSAREHTTNLPATSDSEGGR